MMLCTILTASAIVLADVPARANSVQYYDNAIRVSQRVLDRSICPDIERVHPLDTAEWDSQSDTQKAARISAMESNRRKNRRAVVTHCMRRLETEGLPTAECYLSDEDANLR